MRSQRILKETITREARRAAGRHPRHYSHSAGIEAQTNFDYELLALPEFVDDKEPIQKADGSFYFMVGFSAVGGSDTVA